jgi:predicted TIM-barrel fold metal-dependent hydrolase
VGAEIEEVRQIIEMGAYVEHSICMFVEGSKFKFYDPEILDALIKAGTLDYTILGSDLGQVGNPRPTDGFRAVIGICLDLGYSEEDIRKMVSTNAARLFGLDLDGGTSIA